jgi:hypothetical protein
MGEHRKIPYILVSIQYSMEVASSLMLPFLYLQEDSNLEPKMVLVPTHSVAMVQETSNQYH